MPAAARIGDMDLVHCSVPLRAEGSRNVFVNGLAWSCQSHNNIPHLLPGGRVCTVHAAPVSGGSSKVKVNGLSAGRIGDAISGCTAVAQGSSNVFAG